MRQEKCEKYAIPPKSSIYAGNNPVKYTDPDGKDSILTVYESAGKTSMTRTSSVGGGKYGEDKPGDRDTAIGKMMDIVNQYNDAIKNCEKRILKFMINFHYWSFCKEQ